MATNPKYMQTPIHWSLKPFHDLNPQELYDILQLRSQVFVVEQQCIFQDLDGKDQSCWHLTAYVEDHLMATARLMPPGLAYPEASIGRVVTSFSVRGQKYGKQLMERSVQECARLFGPGQICIGAQCYLLAFYGSVGFIAEGAMYMEDNIPHVKMRHPGAGYQLPEVL